MTIRIAHIPFLLAVFVFSSITANAQNVAVEALVNETTIGTEETVAYTLEVKGVSFADIETPEPPETEGLALLQAVPSTQRNITFINGQLQQSVAFQWGFRPVREGAARIMPLAVSVKGRLYKTEEIRVEVVPQAQRPQRQTRASRLLDPFASPLDAQRDDEAGENESSVNEDDIFIRAVPSARQAYQNEQVTIEYQLYFRNFIQPRHSRLADSWDAEGFWREELDVEARPMPRVTTLNGLRYNAIVLKRVAVFPTRNGALSIDPLRIETEVFAPRTNDPFSRFFSLRNPYETIERASPAITIEAKPLPAGAPESFHGAVGRFDMNAHIDRTDVEVGEPVQMTVRISGTGNLAMLEAPLIKTPGIFETYEPEVKTAIDTGGQRIRGSQTFTYLLVPRSNGTFEIPPVEFAYFDPQTTQYRTLRSEPFSIRVTGTTTTPPATSATAAGLPVDDIAHPLAGTTWTRLHQRPLYRTPWTYVLLMLPLLLIGTTLVYRRHTDRLVSDPAYARNRRAHPLARKHLKQADALLRQDEPRAFYEELERAVLGFVGNRLNIAELAFTRPQLDERLVEAGLSQPLRDDLKQLLDACDAARFSPTRPPHDQMATALDQARGLIIAFDAAFRRQSAPTASE